MAAIASQTARLENDAWPSIVKSMWIDRQLEALLSETSRIDFNQSVDLIRKRYGELFESSEH